MPSEHSTQVSDNLAFTHHTVYSYSECGNYDDTVGWTICNGCGATVQDEYDSIEEDEIEFHVKGECIPQKAERDAARVLVTNFQGLLGVCEWCHKHPCNCPF